MKKTLCCLSLLVVVAFGCCGCDDVAINFGEDRGGYWVDIDYDNRDRGHRYDDYYYDDRGNDGGLGFLFNLFD